MKKILLLFAIIYSVHVFAQKKYEFGVTAGYFYGIAIVKVNGTSIGNSLPVNQGSAFYLGATSSLFLTDEFKLQPELLYVFSGKRGGLLLPISIKYYPIEKVNVLLGPQFDMLINLPNDIKPYVKPLGVGIVFGGGYDINSKWSVQVKYSLGVTQRFNKEIDTFINDNIGALLPGVKIDPSFRANSFQAGVIYKL